MLRKAHRTAPRRLSVHAALLGIFAVQLSPTMALELKSTAEISSANVHNFSLPIGPLSTTLDAISSIGGQQIRYDAEGIKLLQASAVDGSFTIRAALEQAVSGTGLVVEEQKDGGLMVKTTRIQVTAKRDEAETSFKADRSNTTTRGGGYLQDVPASVTLITAKVLETQQATNLVDALRNVSGVGTSQSPQSTTSYSVRGFAASATSNGIADASASMMSVFGVERIEVLKGPQAILSGGDSLGGGVNIVTKKPQAEKVRDLTIQFGSRADKTFALDLSDAITEDQQVSYRLIGAVSDASSAIGGYNGRENKSLMPSLRWKSQSTDLVISASYTKQHAPTPFYTFADRGGNILPVPALPLAHRSDGFDNTGRRISYALEQVLAPSLLLVSRAQRSLEKVELHVPSPLGLTYSDDASPYVFDSSVVFLGDRMIKRDWTSSSDHYLRASFSTGEVQHKLSVGYNHSDVRTNQTEWSGAPFVVQLYPAVPFDRPPIRPHAVDLSSISTSRGKQQGIYLQEMASYGDWNLLVNVRRTRYSRPEANIRIPMGNKVTTTPAEVTMHNTPGLGLVYKLTDDASLYASFSEGFGPQSGFSCSLEKLPPLQTTNKEIGTKLQLLDSKLSLTASLFSLQSSNQLRYQELQGCFTTHAGQRTQGVEVDLQGQVARGLDVIFNYTYKKLKDVEDEFAVYPGEPKQNMSVWSVYNFQEPVLKGYGIGLGLSATSGSLGSYDTTYPFRVPGNAKIDARIFYSGNKFNVTLGVKNLTDRILYSTATSANFVPVLPGREYTFTVKRSF